MLPSVLKGAGLPLEELVSYITKPHPDIAEKIRSFTDQLPDGGVVYVVFFSPSGVDFALRDLLEVCGQRISMKASCLSLYQNTAGLVMWPEDSS